MTTDLTKMNVTDLKKLSKNVVKEIESRTNQAKKTVMKEIKKLCTEAGLEFSELFGVDEQKPAKQKKASSPKKAKAPAEPVYFHQADQSKSWSGRGRKPEWVVTWLGNGGTLEALEKKPW